MKKASVETVPPCLTAMGRRSLPDTIEVGGRQYVRVRVFKNDFFAATALYERGKDKVVLKVGRQAGFWGLPLAWLGRLLAARERSAMLRLHDVDGVPRFIGHWSRTGIVREYIEGRPLAKGTPVPDDFFPKLTRLVAVLHERGMAYGDLEKPENVLVGEDGQPYLFDFQISWCFPARWGGTLWPACTLRRYLQQGDRYHMLKLQRRIRPDQLSAQTLAASYRRPWPLRLHSILTRPLTRVRRRILDRVAPRRKPGERGRVSEDETIEAV